MDGLASQNVMPVDGEELPGNVCMYVCNQNLFRQRPLKSLLGGPSGLF